MMSAMNTPIGVTLFRDAGASTADRRMLSLTDLADMARNTVAPTKAALPWMKAADFGTVRTEKNSLRSNANVLGVNGIEADYDAGRLSVEDAAGLLRKAGVAALVASSPSHLPDLPRWRVVCPLSTRLPPGARHELVGKLNGVLGGVLARESFTLSQGFFIGQTPDSLAPETALIPGEYLDLVDGLQPVYPPRQAADSIQLPTMQPGTPPDARAQQALVAALGAFGVRGGADRHHTLLAATNTVAPFLLAGLLDQSDVMDGLGAAMSADGRDPNPGEVASALTGALRFAQPYVPPTVGEEFPPLPVLALADLQAPVCELTEDSVALAFADATAGRLVYDHTAGRWYRWDGARWCADMTDWTFGQARRFARGVRTKVGAAAAGSAGKIAFAAAVERASRSDTRLAVTQDVWDRDPWVLGVPGGVVDLRTGTLTSPGVASPFIMQTPDRLAGYPYAATNIIPTTPAVTGAGAHPVRSTLVFGSWENLLVGVWDALDLTSNPFGDSAYRRAAVQVRIIADVDVAVRHPEAFCYANDVAG